MFREAVIYRYNPAPPPPPAALYRYNIASRQYCSGGSNVPLHRATRDNSLLITPPPPEMGECAYPVFVHHPASGLMKQPDVHRYSGHIRMKGRLPHVPGHSPRREELAQIIHGHVLGTTMLLMQMAQTVTHRALPHSAPFHQAPPQLSQFQMNVHHVYICPSKNPADCDEIPSPVNYENSGGAAPYPSNVTAWSEIRPSATVGGEKSRHQVAGDATSMSG